MTKVTESTLKFIAPLMAIATFAWGIYTYSETAKVDAEIRKVNSAKPYLEKQLKLYTEVTQITSIISTSENEKIISDYEQRFLELYWGELGMVERGKVTQAMINFKDAIDRNYKQEKLSLLSLELAHACRQELSESWNTRAWLIIPNKPIKRD